MPKKDREHDRLIRKRDLVEGSIRSLEDDISRHELIIADIDALPKAERESEPRRATREAAEAAIKDLRRQITVREKTLSELPEREQPENVTYPSP